jgi:hypothetical protein
MNLIFFCSTTSMMLSGSSMMALIFSFFEFSVAMATMKASKFLLAASVSFVVQRYACQLLLGACQLTFAMFTFTFYELELSSRWSIQSGMWEAIVRASNTAAVLMFRDHLLGGETPLQKRQNAFSDSHPFRKGKKPNTKKGGGGSSPPRPLTISSCTPLLTSQTTNEVRYQELGAHRRSTTVDSVKYIVNMKYATMQYVEGGSCWTGWV